jgi:hypothetical protein
MTALRIYGQRKKAIERRVRAGKFRISFPPFFLF